MLKNNLLLKTDSYKFSHWNQYPKGTENVYSYFESRVGARFDTTVFFGLQYLIKEYLQGVVVSQEKIKEAEGLVHFHLGPNMFNRKGWERILTVHNGKLPLRIKAVPEGSVVPVSNVLMTIEATDPECYWLTNYVETLLVQTWYPSTVATLSRETKKIILSYLEKTGDPSGISFKLHDFGFRGATSCESAGLGGLSHLINFMGTDTVEALKYGFNYYNAQLSSLGFSIPASEHSTITSWGKEHETEAIENVFKQNENMPLVACVSDSWDVYNAASKIYGEVLKDYILSRKGGVVFRPDSGDILEVPVKIIEILMDKFGYTTNAKGYKVLHPKIRVIQGDGCNIDTIKQLLEILDKKKISADNIAFGMGGGLLQLVNRDTQRFAFKCSSITINGEQRDVFKQPVTDSTKNSKRGRLILTKDMRTITEGELGKDIELTRVVFENGELKNEVSFDQVRENAKIDNGVGKS